MYTQLEPGLGPMVLGHRIPRGTPHGRARLPRRLRPPFLLWILPSTGVEDHPDVPEALRVFLRGPAQHRGFVLLPFELLLPALARIPCQRQEPMWREWRRGGSFRLQISAAGYTR